MLSLLTAVVGDRNFWASISRVRNFDLTDRATTVHLRGIIEVKALPIDTDTAISTGLPPSMYLTLDPCSLYI